MQRVFGDACHRLLLLLCVEALEELCIRAEYFVHASAFETWRLEVHLMHVFTFIPSQRFLFSSNGWEYAEASLKVACNSVLTRNALPTPEGPLIVTVIGVCWTHPSTTDRKGVCSSTYGDTAAEGPKEKQLNHLIAILHQKKTHLRQEELVGNTS